MIPRDISKGISYNIQFFFKLYISIIYKFSDEIYVHANDSAITCAYCLLISNKIGQIK